MVGVEICACANCVEGRTAEGTRSCVGSPFGRIAAFASVVTAAAPATATPVRNLRRSTDLPLLAGEVFFVMTRSSIVVAGLAAAPAAHAAGLRFPGNSRMQTVSARRLG